MKNPIATILPTYDFLTAAQGGPETIESEEFHTQRIRNEQGTLQIKILNKGFIIGGSLLQLMGRQSLEGKFVVILAVDITGAVLSSNHTLYHNLPLMAHMKLVLRDAERSVSGNDCQITVFFSE